MSSPNPGFIPLAEARSGAVSFPDLAPLRRCTSLKLTWIEMEDAECLRGVAACESLRTLEFMGCRLNADGLRGLDGLSDLREIRMENCSVRGDLLELPVAPSLQSFRCNHVMFRTLDVSGAPELRRVEAKNCSFSDEGVAMLLDTPHLEVLMFPNGALTDAAVDDLLELRSLRYLDLRHNAQMTRTAIERLADLPQLQTVNVHGTGADEELDRLQQVLPQAKSTFSP